MIDIILYYIVSYLDGYTKYKLNTVIEIDIKEYINGTEILGDIGKYEDIELYKYMKKERVTQIYNDILDYYILEYIPKIKIKYSKRGVRCEREEEILPTEYIWKKYKKRGIDEERYGKKETIQLDKNVKIEFTDVKRSHVFEQIAKDPDNYIHEYFKLLHPYIQKEFPHNIVMYGDKYLNILLMCRIITSKKSETYKYRRLKQLIFDDNSLNTMRDILIKKTRHTIKII